MKRNPEQPAHIVEQTILQIRDKATQGLAKKNMDRIIQDTCARNEISETHVRRVAGWKKEETNVCLPCNFKTP